MSLLLTISRIEYVVVVLQRKNAPFFKCPAKTCRSYFQSPSWLSLHTAQDHENYEIKSELLDVWSGTCTVLGLVERPSYNTAFSHEGETMRREMVPEALHPGDWILSQSVPPVPQIIEISSDDIMEPSQSPRRLQRRGHHRSSSMSDIRSLLDPEDALNREDPSQTVQAITPEEETRPLSNSNEEAVLSGHERSESDQGGHALAHSSPLASFDPSTRIRGSDSNEVEDLLASTHSSLPASSPADLDEHPTASNPNHSDSIYDNAPPGNQTHFVSFSTERRNCGSRHATPDLAEQDEGKTSYLSKDLT